MKLRSILGMVAASLPLLAGCQRGPAVSDLGVQAAVVPGADVVADIDVQASNQSPVGQQMLTLMADSENDAQVKAIETALGVSRKDVVRLYLTADLDPVVARWGEPEPPAEAPAEAEAPADEPAEDALAETPETAAASPEESLNPDVYAAAQEEEPAEEATEEAAEEPAAETTEEPAAAEPEWVAAVELAKALSPRRVQAAVKAGAATEKKDIQAERINHDGFQLLRLMGADVPKPTPEQPLVIGFATGNKLLFIGVEEQVTAALDRLRSGEPAPEVGRIAQAVDTLPGDPAMYVAFVPGEAVEAKLDAQLAKMEAQAAASEAERLKQMADMPMMPGAETDDPRAQSLRQSARAMVEKQDEALQALQNADMAALTVAMGEDVTYTLRVGAQDEEQAQTLASFVETQVAMMYGMFPPEAAQAMGLPAKPTVEAEGQTAALHLVLTAEELQRMMDQAKAAQARRLPRPGGTMTPFGRGNAPMPAPQPEAPAATETPDAAEAPAAEAPAEEAEATP